MVRACIEAMRPLNSIMMGLAVVVGAVIAAGPEIDPARLLLGALAGVLYTGASMIHNDIVDLEIDRVNTPWRPLPSGRLSVRRAWACVIALAVLGAIVVYPLGLLALGLAVGALLLAMAYNVWGKVRGLVGNIMVAAIVSFPILYGAVVVNRLYPTILVFASMVFLSSLGREIAKDIADVEGDRRAGARTLPITRGTLFASRAAATLYLAAVALSPLPLLLGGVNPPVYALGVAVVDAGFILEALKLWRGVTPQEARAHKRRVLRIMLIGLLVFLASTITAGGRGPVELVAELDGGGDIGKWARRLAGLYDWLDIPDSPMGKPGPHSLLAACAIQARHRARVIPHIRLYDVTYTGFKAIAKTLSLAGIERLVVLRGDPPRRGSRVEDLTPEEAMEIVRSKAPGIEVGLLLSMRKPWESIAERLHTGPDFVLVLHYRARGREGLEKLAKEARQQGVKLLPYLVAATSRNREITGRLGDHSLVEEENLPREAGRLEGLVDGILVSSPGDPEALVRLGERLQGLRT